MKKIFSILLLLISLTQCFSTFSNEENFKSKDEIKIQDHFVFLTVHLKLKKKSYESCLEENSCITITDINSHVKKLNITFINAPILVGSSFVFKHVNNKSRILTSDHVCLGIKSYLKFDNVLVDSKYELLDTLGKNKNYNYLDMIQLKSNYDLTSVVTLFDFKGNKYEGVIINKQNKAKDLCIITSNNIIGTPVTFNEDNCNYGEEVINVSASDGNYFPSAVPFHIGAYSGTIKNKRFVLFGKNEEVSLYTLNIDQGSSGSGVFSKKTKKLCGNINAKMNNSNLSIGSSNNAILEFIK